MAETSSPAGEATIRFTVKELIAGVRVDVAQLSTDVKDGFRRVETQLDSKADKADLVAVHARLDEHEAELRHLKDVQRDDESASKALATERSTTASKRQWAIGIAVSLALVGVGVLEVVR